jgi:hypothetical protein
MLRWMMPIVVATFALTSAAEAVGPAGKSAARRAASQLPTGLPRAHYKFRTTITRARRRLPAPVCGRRAEVLFTPSDGYVRYVPPAVGIEWWPGYPAWSGNWGLPFDYNYPSPWYAGPESIESNLQPYGYGYGCGYGYC